MTSQPQAPIQVSKGKPSNWLDLESSDRDIFCRNYLYLYNEAKQLDLEAGWHGLVDYVILCAIQRTRQPGLNTLFISWPQYPAIVPQVPEPEPPAADVVPGLARRHRSATTSGSFYSLSNAPSVVEQMDDVSAVFSSISIGDSSISTKPRKTRRQPDKPTEVERDDRVRYPDWVVLYGEYQHNPSDVTFRVTEQRTANTPTVRIACVIELKRIPPVEEFPYMLIDGSDMEAHRVERFLKTGKIKQQVFEQIQALFSSDSFAEQRKIWHILIVGNYFVARIFHRETFVKRDWIPFIPEKIELSKVPPWKAMSPSQGNLYSIVNDGGNDFSAEFKANWTKGRAQAAGEIHDLSTLQGRR
ncbi:hypothetical protein BDW22DRAFT_1428140 [Trametopsis cervina]|nr:hypothetical protein BDW22DRAFT_1428140 [Trametopsis cervina]